MFKVNKIKDLGLSDIKEVYHNLSYDELFEKEQTDPYGSVTSNGTFSVDTGIFTGRSPKDKYFVMSEPSSKNISWGPVNKAVTKEIFDELFSKVKKQLSGKNIYVQDAYCGAAQHNRKSIRVVTEIAWQAHFVKNMFIRPSEDDLKNFEPDFTMYNAGKLSNKDYEKHGLHSDVFIVFNIEENIAIIGGTWYGGEMKKGIFSMMNYWLPLEGKLSMHCSANVGVENEDTALFFGLSGTGKTTLSTDKKRRLIGDDEHGWDDKGIFNFEGGCYAKCIGLDAQSEPEIFGAIKRDALLENVVLDEDGRVDYNDGSKTENTRVSYPIEHIKNHKRSLKAPHPKKIIFLTADAFGVLPPVSRLTKEQAMYYFMSGYTAKVAGTERGITEPVATFSSCFGEAFLPLHPTVYAKLLGEKIDKHNVDVYLVNTGWTGGVYGIGNRMSIKETRACIDAILDGSIENEKFEKTPIFELSIPIKLKGVKTDILNPRNTWKNKSLFDASQKELANMFIKNFKKYITEESDFSGAGPKI
ncbi:MAG: phosphoenolpyruvate carboxykinase (ATP) [Sulfurospirillum sp.]|nr:phosphoenolpyruvate carboxykinase (ATP) [Sulfurospirillum sp.]